MKITRFEVGYMYIQKRRQKFQRDKYAGKVDDKLGGKPPNAGNWE